MEPSDGPNEGEHHDSTNNTPHGEMPPGPYIIVDGVRRPVDIAPTPPGWTSGAAGLSLRTKGLPGIWELLTTTVLGAEPPTAVMECVKAWRDAPGRLRGLSDLHLYHVVMFLRAQEGMLLSGEHTGAFPPQPGSIMARLCSAVEAENERRKHAEHRNEQGTSLGDSLCVHVDAAGLESPPVWPEGMTPLYRRWVVLLGLVDFLRFDDGLNHHGDDTAISSDPRHIGLGHHPCVDRWQLAPGLLPALSDAELQEVRVYLISAMMAMWNGYYGTYPPHPESHMAVLIRAVDAEILKRQLAPFRARHALLTTLSLCMYRRAKDRTESPIANGIARELAATSSVLMPEFAALLLVPPPRKSQLGAQCRGVLNGRPATTATATTAKVTTATTATATTATATTEIGRASCRERVSTPV